MSKFTVFGGRGFIGSEFVKELKVQDNEVFIPERDDTSIYDIDLGTVIYCAGYGDCQRDPFNVLYANVILLSSLLEKGTFDKLVYISSTRVYMNQTDSVEDCNLTICNDDNRRLFNLTKLTAEELCLKSQKNCLIVRPSNVYGVALNSPLFLPSITRDAINNGIVNMYVNKNYVKDYVSVKDVVDATLSIITKISIENKVINIASGFNISANDIATALINKTNCKINWLENKTEVEIFSEIDISELKLILKDYKPKNVLDDLNIMVDEFKLSL